MAGITLTSKTINSTYDSLLKLTDNDGLTASFKKITDGLGNDSGISINNAGNVQISGTLNVSGTTTIGSVLRGNATLTIDPAAHGDNTGLVVIAGDLQVDGTTTTINSTTVSIDDKNILLAAEAANKAAANGAGITVETGTNDPVVTDATILYNGTNDTWDFNKWVTASKFVGDLTGDVVGDLTGNLTGNVNLNDNDQILAGTGNDLSIYHSGSHSFIRQLGTGNLYIDQASDNQSIVFRNDNGSGGLDNYYQINGSTERNVFYKTVNIDTGHLRIGDVSVIDSSRNIVVESGTFNDGAHVKKTSLSSSTVLTIEQLADVGSSQDLVIKNSYDRDVGIKLETAGGSHYIWQDSNGDDALIISAVGANRTDDATIIFTQGHDVNIPNGDLTVSGTVTATGGNSTEWNTGYDYSQIGHLPLVGGTLTGNLTMSADDDRIYFGNRNGAIFFDTTLDALAMQQTQGTDWTRIHVGDISTGNYKFKVLGGDSTNSSEFAATGWNDLFTINGDGDTDLVTGNLQIGSTVVITTARNLTNIGTGSFSGDITFANGQGIVSSAGAEIKTGSGGNTFQVKAGSSTAGGFIVNNSAGTTQFAADQSGAGWSYFAGDLAVNQTTQPTHKLEVNGTAEIKGSLYLNAADSLGFEDGKHWITYNDGEGNFNIRVGHKANDSVPDVEETTEEGYVFHDEWSQSAGWRQFNISNTSTLVGDLEGTDWTWRTQIEYDTNSVYLRHQGNTRLTTASNGVYVDGGGVRINGTTNNLWIEETTNNEWHIYDTFQDNGIIIHSSSGGMEFQYNGNTELTINGAGVVFNGTVDISNANLNIGAADIVFDTVSTNANRGLVWDVDGSYLSKLVSGGTNTGMVEIYTNMNDGITGDVFRVKTGSTATIPFSIDNTGDATFTDRVLADTLELTSGSAHLTFTESAEDWSITNNYTGYNNGLTIFNGTGGIALNYAGSEIANFNTNGIALNDGVDITGGLEVSANVNVTGDTYTLGEFSQGVTTANKIYAYGSEFRSSGASIQIVFGRDTNSIGSGAIGADSTNCFAVWNTDSTVKRMSISQGGSMAIGNITPTHKLTVDGDISCDDIFLTGDVDLGDTGIVKNTNAVFFNNSEMSTAYYPDASGTLAFDENFYSDTTYGTGTYNPAQVWGSDGGGLVVKSEDGWGGVFTSVNSRWATPTWDGLIVNNEIGVGVTSPQAGLHINHSTKPQLLLDGGSDTTGDIVVPDGEILQVGHWNNSTSTYTDRFRIDSNGYVTIKNNAGTTNASLTLSNNDTGIAIDQSIGYLNFYANDASTTSTGGVGGIALKAEEAFNTSYTPTYLTFYTHERTANDGTLLGNVIERMRIDSSGNVGVNVDPSYKLHIDTDTNNDGITLNGQSDNLRFNIKNDQVTSGQRAFSMMMSGSYPALIFQAMSDSLGFVRNIMALTHGGDMGLNQLSPSSSISSNATVFQITDGNVASLALHQTSTGKYEIAADGLGLDFRRNAVSFMVLDTSGRLLVGKTSSGYSTEGVEIRSNEILATNDGGTVLSLNRLTSDGTILSLAQDTVGIANINSIGDDIYFDMLQGGNLGIGDTSPDERLSVNGNIALNGDVEWTNGEISSDDNNTGARIVVRAKSNPTDGNAIFAVESSGSATRFGVTQGYGGWFRDKLQVGYVYDSAGLSDPTYHLDVAGTIRATGDVIAYSDKRVKENIKTIDSAIDKVSRLRGVEYNKIGEDAKRIGVIAQEIEEVLPEVVHEDDNGMKSVAYGNIVGVLIEAIKDQQKQIDELKAKLHGST